MNQTKSTSKKLLALLLALIMTVSLLPMSVFAAELATDEPAPGTEAVIDVLPADGEDTEDVGDAEPADDEGDVTLPEEPEEDAEPEEDVTQEPEEDEELADTYAADGIAVQAITIAEQPVFSGTTEQPFVANIGAGNSFRIPAMVTLNNGTIVAAADARWEDAHDGGGNDTIVAYSTDNGKNWNHTFANYMGDNNLVWTRDSTTFIDPALATDGTNVYMLVDLFVHGRSNAPDRDAMRKHVTGSGIVEGKLRLAYGSSTTYNYYLNLTDSKIYDSNNNEVSGYTVDKYFNITSTAGSVNTNLFFADSPYQVYPTIYTYLTKSSNGGKTWSEPTLFDLGNDNEYGCLVGPGRGIVATDGTIIFPFYNYPGSGSLQLGFLYSTDNGATWKRSDSGVSGSTEGTIVELSDGTLRVFYRTTSDNNRGIHYMDVTGNGKNGYTWNTKKNNNISTPAVVSGATSYSNCQLSAIKYSKTVKVNDEYHETIIVSCPTGSSRVDGYLYLLDAETMTVLGSYSVYKSNYQYSCLTELKNGNIGLLYETHEDTVDTNGTIQYATYDPSVIFSNVKFEESTDPTPGTTEPGETDPSTPETPADGETIVIKVGKGQPVEKSYTFDANVTVSGGSYSDDYCDVTWKANTVPGGTSFNKVETPAAGEYYISDGTNYLKLTSTTDWWGNISYSVGTTTERADATMFTFAASGSSYTISADMSGTTVYLGYSNNYNSYSLSVGRWSNSTWTWNANGIYYTNNSRAYYLNYSNGWTLSRNPSTKGYAYKEVTNEPVNAAKLTVTGKVAGTSEEFQIGNKKFRVEVVDGYFAEVAVGGTKTISLSEANVTLQEGQTVVWTVGDDGKYAGIYSVNGTDATLTGREEGPTTATATVKNADGTVAGTYNWLVTVTEGTKLNAGNYEVAYDITNTVYNGKLYYSVSGSPLKEATPDGEPTTDEYGNTIRKYTISETETGVAYSQLELFVAPDEGYAVSKIAASTTAQGSQFYGLNKSDYTAIYDEENHKGGKLESVLTEGQVKSLIKEAVDAGCDAVLWYSRGDNGNKEYHTDPKGPLTKNDSVTATLYYYCDKLPTIDKEISHLIMSEKVVDYTTDGMVADAGDQVVFKITVTGYPESAKITYTNGSLNDKMANIQLYSDGTLTTPLANPYNITAALDADRVSATQNTTYTYYAAYTLTEKDLQQGRKLENTVDLTYNYKSTYSTGTYGGASKADATFQLTDFPQINDIVVDFGLPVKVLDGVKWAESYADTISVQKATAKYGDVEAKGNNQKGLTVIYTPNTMTREIDTVTLTSSRGNTSTFHVIPASTVYYEDSFASFYDADSTEAKKTFEATGGASDKMGKWYVDSDNTAQSNNVNQALEALGSKKNVYGYDAAYDSCTTFSMGSAKKVTVDASVTTNPTATFTFKGTGFDVISLTDNNSGAIIVNVTGKDEANKKYNKNFLVDNYYGYKYNATSSSWEIVKDNSDTLYQIPVMKVTGLDYGTYDVTITVAYGAIFDHDSTSGYSFWLDAIRVYDPMGKNYEGYNSDGEGWPQYIEIRNQLIDSNTFDGDGGVVFIEGSTEADVEAYKNGGPNNEVYLLKDQSIAFQLNIPDGATVDSVQIGAKAPMGRATLMVNDSKVGPKDDAGEATDITTATEMYYDITAAATTGNKIVTITNGMTGSSILALTNVKVTFTGATSEEVTFTMSEAAAAEAVQMVRAMYAPAPEPDPEPVVFVPERFEASWSRSTVKVGQKATLTVKASEDVDAITVDGVTIDTYRTRTQRTSWGWNAKRVTYREFTYTITANEAGTLNCSVAAVNGENVASEPITAALTVQAAAQRPSWGGWLGNLFGRWF